MTDVSIPSDFLTKVQAALPPGYVIDDYLDRGGQGAVFRGAFNGESVAIKLFHPLGNTARRLARELDLLQRVDCPFLVKVRGNHEVTVEGVCYPLVAYEYLPGGDLRDLLRPDSVEVAYRSLCTIGHQISVAVEVLWGNRIVHRDIKPGNIMQSTSERYVLVDVGLARHLDRSDITALGGAPGTLGYKSPEQAGGRRHLTIHSDVFSLGVTLYQLATRRHPFNNDQNLVGRLVPTLLHQVRPSIPVPFSRLIQQMMESRPSDRPANVSQRFRQFSEE
jgi:eukaryotic-like serine/threonine-protein kinase